MATRTITVCTCDICGKRIDRPYRGGESGTYTLCATADYAIAGESLVWKELCTECNSWLGGLIDDLKYYAECAKKPNLVGTGVKQGILND